MIFKKLYFKNKRIYRKYMDELISNIENNEESIEKGKEDMKPVLIKFLDKLKTQMVDNKMTEKDEEIVGKFFMEYNCRNSLFKDGLSSEGATRDEMTKYLFLGYYIYNFVLNKNESV